MKIFCIIPAYNEEQNIVAVIKNVKPLVDKVVVVDDGSKDKTYELARAQGVCVLRHVINRGQGASLETGDQYALRNGADVIVHFDADGQFLASEIKELTAFIQAGQADIVFGSRFMEKKSDLPWLKKNIAFPLARLVNYIFFNAVLTDPQCGFRAMNAKAARQIRIVNDGMAHCSEIIGKAFQYKLKIKEAPVTVIYHEFGQRLSGGFRVVKDLILSKLIG